MNRPLSLSLFAVLFACFVPPAFAAHHEKADAGFKPLFDGKSLNGWKAPEMKHWSVRDGAITAESTEKLAKNQFLVWQLGDLDDFELKLKYRISGSPSANSGIQVRSQIKPDGHAEGYQADIDLAGKWAGTLYDEHTGRRALAPRGKKTVIDQQGKRVTTDIGDADKLMPKPGKDGWIDYHIIARGTHITLKVNGKVVSETIDDELKHRDLTGKLALQIHSGPPMKVQFKDIMLKRLPLAKVDGKDRRKLVMVAGKPSHPPRMHEFNAGIKLLKKGLEQGAPQHVYANYHDNGWPKDPTAFDNANGIVLYMDGWRQHGVLGHFEELDAIMKRGVGLMLMHYAVHIEPGEQGKYFQDWVGGFYETRWSVNPHWVAKSVLHRDHAMTRGVKPFEIKDEWYFNMRFKADDKGIARILQAVPDDIARSGTTTYPRGPLKHIVAASGRTETLMWAIERKDGGRGVGFTGGHYHDNWIHPQLRKLVLNGMLWTAGAEVPKQGVASTVTKADLDQNLDPKGKRKKPAPKKKPAKK